MSTAWEYTKAMPRSTMFNLLHPCLSGDTIFKDDVEHIFDVYGDTWRREVNTLTWKPYNDQGEPVVLPEQVWVVYPLQYRPGADESLQTEYKIQSIEIRELNDLLRAQALYGSLFRTEEQAEMHKTSLTKWWEVKL